MFYVSKHLCEFYYAIHVPNSLNSHVSMAPILMDFSDWNEQVQFNLSVLDLDLATLEDKSITITDASSNEEKTHYKVWKRSKRLNLMLMRMNFADNIKTTLLKIESAKRFMGLVGERS